MKVNEKNMFKPSDKQGHEGYVDITMNVWLEDVENKDVYLRLEYDENTGLYKKGGFPL